MIRPAKPEDYEDLYWLQRICYLRPCTREELREKLAGPAWVWVDGEDVVGAIICSDVNKPWVWSVTVASPYQRHGIANKLLAVVEAYYVGQEIGLRVDSANPAKHLYEGRGYTTRQILKDYYGKGLDAVEMTRPA